MVRFLYVQNFDILNFIISSRCFSRHLQLWYKLKYIIGIYKGGVLIAKKQIIKDHHWMNLMLLDEYLFGFDIDYDTKAEEKSN